MNTNQEDFNNNLTNVERNLESLLTLSPEYQNNPEFMLEVFKRYNKSDTPVEIFHYIIDNFSDELLRNSNFLSGLKVSCSQFFRWTVVKRKLLENEDTAALIYDIDAKFFGLKLGQNLQKNNEWLKGQAERIHRNHGDWHPFCNLIKNNEELENYCISLNPAVAGIIYTQSDLRKLLEQMKSQPQIINYVHADVQNHPEFRKLCYLMGAGYLRDSMIASVISLSVASAGLLLLAQVFALPMFSMVFGAVVAGVGLASVGVFAYHTYRAVNIDCNTEIDKLINRINSYG